MLDLVARREQLLFEYDTFIIFCRDSDDIYSFCVAFRQSDCFYEYNLNDLQYSGPFYEIALYKKGSAIRSRIVRTMTI